MAQALIDPIRIWADGSSYLHFQDRTKSYVEVYCAFQRADFQFEDKNGVFEAIGFLYAEAFDKNGALADSTSRFVIMSVQFLEDAYKKDVRIFEVLPLLAGPGEVQPESDGRRRYDEAKRNRHFRVERQGLLQ